MLPKWYEDSKKYGLILTDDIDSLLSCTILKQVKQWEIDRVLIFKADKDKTIDYMGITDNATNEAVGVDLALQNGKCFDNHVSRINKLDTFNRECINLNIIKDVTRENYFNKYNLSTVLLLWSLYDLPIPESEDGKMILLTIDSSYYSYFSYPKFKEMNKFYLCDVLGLNELYECQARHKQYEFKKIEKQYKLKSKIKLNNGYLQTDIDLDGINIDVGLDTNIWCTLPNSRFNLYKKFYDIQIPLMKQTTKLSDITKNPYSVALTNRDFLCYSEEITEKE